MAKTRYPHLVMRVDEAQRLMDESLGIKPSPEDQQLARLAKILENETGLRITFKTRGIRKGNGEIVEGYLVSIHPKPLLPQKLGCIASKQLLNQAFLAAGLLDVDIRSKDSMAWVSKASLEQLLSMGRNNPDAMPQAYDWFVAGVKDGMAEVISAQNERC